MTADEMERRADAARQLINNALVQEIFDSLEKRLVNELVGPDNDKRDELIMRIKVMRDLRVNLETIIRAGDQAARKKPSVA